MCQDFACHHTAGILRSIVIYEFEHFRVLLLLEHRGRGTMCLSSLSFDRCFEVFGICDNLIRFTISSMTVVFCLLREIAPSFILRGGFWQRWPSAQRQRSFSAQWLSRGTPLGSRWLVCFKTCVHLSGMSLDCSHNIYIYTWRALVLLVKYHKSSSHSRADFFLSFACLIFSINSCQTNNRRLLNECVFRWDGA